MSLPSRSLLDEGTFEDSLLLGYGKQRGGLIYTEVMVGKGGDLHVTTGGEAA